MKRLVYVFTILIFCAGFNFSQNASKLTKSKATAKFKQFVIDNGYTDLPPTNDKSKLIHDSLEGLGEVQLSLRKNTLERKPFILREKNNGWEAVFLYKNHCQKCLAVKGRVVYMNSYGEILGFEYDDINIGKVQVY
jgi:hypothetical protein